MFHLQWLEANLGLYWSQKDEWECQCFWEVEDDKLIQSYPTHAFLLILRDYIMGKNSDIDSRLRRLIPILSRLGDSSIALSALILLGIIIMESRRINKNA